MTYENRIRYGKVEENVYRSVRRYDGFLVLLYLEERRYKIVDDLNTVVAEGQVLGGPHKLKKAAKKALSNLGIKFLKEKRNKGKEDGTSSGLLNSNRQSITNGKYYTGDT